VIVPAWCERFTRFEYADKGRGPLTFDCWGFVRHVEREQFGVNDLPDLVSEYTSAKDHRSVAEVVERYESALAASWRRIERPQPGDIIILNIAAMPWHCGVAVGGDWMMHMLKGVNVGVEHFTREPWRNRVEGFYRHV
jgi:cell wall-associated NlpC family hydrolase